MEQAVLEQKSGRSFFSRIYRAILAGQPIGRREFAARQFGSGIAWIAFVLATSLESGVESDYAALGVVFAFVAFSIFQLAAMYWRLRDCWERRRTAWLWLLATCLLPFIYIWWLFKPSIKRGGTYAPAGYALSVLLGIAAISAFLQPIGSFA